MSKYLKDLPKFRFTITRKNVVMETHVEEEEFQLLYFLL